MYAGQKLGLARVGDTSWTTIGPDYDPYEDFIFFDDQFYAINLWGKVVVFDIHGPHHPPIATLIVDISLVRSHYQKFYLVELLGEWLVVFKTTTHYCEGIDGEDYSIFNELNPLYKTTGFQVYKLDLTNEDKQVVKNLGQHSLFLGFNASVSLLASDSSGWRSNCIYFTDDFAIGYLGTDTKGGIDMGVFDLKDGSIKPHHTGFSTSYFSPPLWIIPNSIVKH